MCQRVNESRSRQAVSSVGYHCARCARGGVERGGGGRVEQRRHGLVSSLNGWKRESSRRGRKEGRSRHGKQGSKRKDAEVVLENRPVGKSKALSRVGRSCSETASRVLAETVPKCRRGSSHLGISIASHHEEKSPKPEDAFVFGLFALLSCESTGRLSRYRPTTASCPLAFVR
jgi:hypothetical protein